MIRIDKNNEIHITKGDSAYLIVDIATRSGRYTPHEGDVLAMTVRHRDDTLVFKKEIYPTGTFEILPIDTAEVPKGRYKYDIQLTTSGGEICTVIPCSKFCIDEEVTYD